MRAIAIEGFGGRERLELMDLAKADTFELVAASAEHYQTFGYAYMVTEATNQWTGAAIEELGGVCVHFAPFQGQQPFARVPSRLRAS
jgi:hypothetical protein